MVADLGLQSGAPRGLSSSGPQLGGRLVVTPPAHSLPARRVVELSFPVQRPREKTDALPLRQTIVFATANVLTLAPGDVREAARGLMVSGRVALLQSQFHNQGVHMVGVQEARTPGPDIRASDKYVLRHHQRCYAQGHARLRAVD